MERNQLNTNYKKFETALHFDPTNNSPIRNESIDEILSIMDEEEGIIPTDIPTRKIIPERKKCEICEVKESIGYCKDCDDKICFECLLLYHKKKRLSHEVFIEVSHLNNLKNNWMSELSETKSKLIDDVLNRDMEISMLRQEINQSRETIMTLEKCLRDNNIQTLDKFSNISSYKEKYSDEQLVDKAISIRKKFGDLISQMLSNEKDLLEVHLKCEENFFK
jgi:hypothetical protein